MRRQGSKFGCQIDVGGGRNCSGVIGQYAHLFCSSLHHGFPSITDIDAPDATGEHVEIFIAAGVRYVTAVPGHHDLGFLVVQQLVVREVEPQMFPFQCNQVVYVQRLCHEKSLPSIFNEKMKQNTGVFSGFSFILRYSEQLRHCRPELFQGSRPGHDQ